MRSSKGFRLARRWALGFTLWLAPAHVEANEAPARAVNDLPPRVALAVVGSQSKLGLLEVRLASWFRWQPTELSVRRADEVDAHEVLSPIGEAGVRVWLVPHGPDTARLFFTVVERSGSMPRYLVRDVTLDGGFDELGVEQVAQVIYLSSTALWAGTLESSREEVELRLDRKPASPPPPGARESAPKSQPATLESLLGFEYTLRSAGDEGTSHGPAATLGVNHPIGEQAIGARAQAGLIFPHSVEKRGIALDLRGASFYLGALLSQPAFERLSAVTELGLGLDVVRYRVDAITDPTLVAARSETETRPFVRLRAGLTRSISHVTAGIAAGASIQLLETHYDVLDQGRRQRWLTPWQLQPELAGSVTW
jgi:hypothetical protein